MTCIVGVADRGRVVIGGDSAGVAGWSLTVRADRKVFRNGAYILGFTSSFRMGQLLRYAFQPPEPPDWDVYKFMATGFVDAVRKCLKDGGYAETNNGVEKGGHFLVGYGPHLFQVEGDYQVAVAEDGYAAVGCGQDVAVGSLYATKDIGLPPEARVKLALQASERHNAGVRGPFHIETLGAPEVPWCEYCKAAMVPMDAKHQPCNGCGETLYGCPSKTPNVWHGLDCDAVVSCNVMYVVPVRGFRLNCLSHSRS